MLYVLAPVLVRVLLDGSGHDSAEIDGTVERHASSTPTKQPVPAPRRSSVKSSSEISNMKLDLKNSCSPTNTNNKSRNSDIVHIDKACNKNDTQIIINNKIAKADMLNFEKSTKGGIASEVTESKVPEIKKISKDANAFGDFEIVDLQRSESYSSRSNNDIDEPKPEMFSFEKKTVTTVEVTENTLDLDTGKSVKKVTSTRTITETDGKQESWRTMSSSGEASVPADLWETQFSIDISPVSGNEETYMKNGSRQGTISDTESDGSPHRRRRSPNRRRTLGSSSGSDVALHEGAELSPMEDDQGTSLTANLLSKQCTYPAGQLSLSDNHRIYVCLPLE